MFSVINFIVNNQETYLISATVRSREEVINSIFLTKQLLGVHVFRIAYCDGINMKQFTAIEAGKSDEIKGSYKAALRKYVNTHSSTAIFLMLKNVYYLFISCTYSNFLYFKTLNERVFIHTVFS